jgi:hypothetical protein
MTLSITAPGMVTDDQHNDTQQIDTKHPDIMTVGMTVGMTTVSITLLNIMTFSIQGFVATLVLPF